MDAWQKACRKKRSARPDFRTITTTTNFVIKIHCRCYLNFVCNFLLALCSIVKRRGLLVIHCQWRTQLFSIFVDVCRWETKVFVWQCFLTFAFDCSFSFICRVLSRVRAKRQIRKGKEKDETPNLMIYLSFHSIRTDFLDTFNQLKNGKNLQFIDVLFLKSW